MSYPSSIVGTSQVSNPNIRYFKYGESRQPITNCRKLANQNSKILLIKEWVVEDIEEIGELAYDGKVNTFNELYAIDPSSGKDFLELIDRQKTDFFYQMNIYFVDYSLAFYIVH